LDNIYTNFNILIDSIERISNKLYVNWLNIRPLTLTNYRSSILYNESIKTIIRKNNKHETKHNELKKTNKIIFLNNKNNNNKKTHKTKKYFNK
jgi:hypothetical protein